MAVLSLGVVICEFSRCEPFSEENAYGFRNRTWCFSVKYNHFGLLIITMLLYVKGSYYS